MLVRSFSSNPYKRQDVFRCVHDSHQNFENVVSVYHVMREKKCFPEGCIYFKWKCNILNKGKSCKKKFQHVGRKCFGCKEFYDEKVQYHARLLLSEEEFKLFKEELDKFESWLSDVKGKQVNFVGTVNSVKPSFKMVIENGVKSIFFNGFILNFKSGFFDYVNLQDFCYIEISKDIQHRYKFVKGDKIDLYGYVSEDKGRIVLKRANRISIDFKSHEGEYWTESNALVARKTGKIIKQSDKCFQCQFGSLLDCIEIREKEDNKRFHRLFCLKGCEEPEYCPYYIEKILYIENCARDIELL